MALKELIQLNANINRSITMLQIMEPAKGYYVAFSGGKDSIVLLSMVKQAEVKYDAHYSITGIDPKEIIPFIKKNYPEVSLDKPAESMYDLVVKHGLLPTRQKRFCCGPLKEKHGEGRVVATGIRWEESIRRREEWDYVQFNNDYNKIIINPILSWTNNNVWTYIKDNGLAYPKLYDEGHQRIGCVACPMANAEQQREDLRKYPNIKKMYMRAIKKHAQINPDSFFASMPPEEIIRWWVSGMTVDNYKKYRKKPQ
jgi:phosphoadenosine phosphosulfate reductase